MKIIQILPTLSFGDAVGNDTIALHYALLRQGYMASIYAENIDSRLPAGICISVDRLPPLCKDDILLMHLSTGTPLNAWYARQTCRKMLVYHNITPPEFFEEESLRLVRLYSEGYRQAEALSAAPDYCLADSAYNKQELRRMGYQMPIDVLPILIPFEDYQKESDCDVLRKYNDGYTNILFCGRISPNKKQEDVIAAFAEYHKTNPFSRLFLVGNAGGLEHYQRRLKAYAKHLGVKENVVFTGHISFAAILAYYHLADLFLCLSEHEGFCVPLVEAMHFNIPILAYDSSAIADTLGGSGVLLKDKSPAFVAAMMERVLCDERLHQQILRGQKKRLEDFANDKIENQFLQYLKAFIEIGREST